MAAKEVYKSREIMRTLEGWAAKRVWLVDGTDGIAVATHDDVDEPGDAYPNAPTVICKRQRTAWKDINHYLVTCDYNDKSTGPSGPHEVGDWDESWDMHTRTENAPIDRDGADIGQDGEGADVLVPHARLNVTTWLSNRSDYSPFYNLVGKVNSDEFKGLAAGKWLCMGVRINKVTDSMLKVEYGFELRDETSGWQYEWYPYQMQDVVINGETVKRKTITGAAQTARIYDATAFNAIWP